MRLNVFEVDSLSRIFDRQFAGRKLTEAFSTSAQDVFLDFEGLVLKCSFYDGELYFQTTDWEKRPKRNRQLQFVELLGQLVTRVEAIPLDRVVVWHFDGGNKLVIRMFGRFSQLASYTADKLQQQFPLKTRRYEQFPVAAEDPLDQEAVKAHFSWLGQEAVDFLLKGQAAGRALSQLTKAYSEMHRPPGFALDEQNGEWVLVPSQTPNADLSVFTEYTSRRLSAATLAHARKQLLNEQLQKIKRLMSKIGKQQKALKSIEATAGYKHQADLIMANIYRIESGEKQVELLDFDGLTEHVIKLDPRLSPQANAERFYKKSKKENLRMEHLRQNLKALNEELAEAQERKQQIISTEDRKELLKQYKQEDANKQSVRLPYRKIMLDGFELRVGRSAKDNDDLLRRYSSAHDLWFHAYKVSGSHVILRLAKGQQTDQQLLEKVAAVAAYHSKARPEGLARVIYTYRKFVRKPKKANPGAVLVEHETSLLVDPQLGKL